MRHSALLRYLQVLRAASRRELAASIASDTRPIAVTVPIEWSHGRSYWLDVRPGVSLPRRVVLMHRTEGMALGEARRSYDGTGWQVTLTHEVEWTRATVYSDMASYAALPYARLEQLITRVEQEGEDSECSVMLRDALGHGGLHLCRTALPNPGDAITSGLSREQVAALRNLFRGRVGALLGVPGSGKTTTLAAAVTHAAASGMSVLCLAPSDDAANVLDGALCDRARLASTHQPIRLYSGMRRVPLVVRSGVVVTATIAMALSRLLSKECTPDVLVIDECSMVGAATYVALATLPKRHLIIAGDPLQLPPIVRSSDDRGLLGMSALDLSGATDRWTRGIPRASDGFLDVSHRLPAKVVDTIVAGWPEAQRLRAARSYWSSPGPSIPAPLVVLDTTAWLQESPLAAPAGAPTHAALWAALARMIRQEQRSTSLSVLALSPYRRHRDDAAAAARDRLTPYGSPSVLDARTIHQAQGMTANVVGLDLLPLPGRSIRDAKFLGVESSDGDGRRALLVGLSRANVATFLAAPRWVLDAPGDTAVARLVRALPGDTPVLDALAFLEQARPARN